MKLGIINSAFGQAGVDTKTGLEHISRIGFDAVDIFTEAMTIAEDEVNLIKSTCKFNTPLINIAPGIFSIFIDQSFIIGINILCPQ